VFERRLTTAIVVAALVALPAFTLRVLCVGRSCDTGDDASAEVPFCSLPADLREPVAAGFREGRSPDVLVVARRTGIAGGSSSAPGVPWPGSSAEEADVPIVVWGTGVAADAEIPAGTGLDDIAPTIARIIGLARPHPEVRSGAAIEGIATGEPPRLVLEIALEGMGSTDLRTGDWPTLERLMAQGAATFGAQVGSTPTDPAAVLTTIGTGGLPLQHGITGSLVRNDSGDLVRSWGPDSPLSIIATLGDDLDEKLNQHPVIGLVAKSSDARGLIGGEWYVDVDEDEVRYATGPKATDVAVHEALSAGFGRDDVPDLLALALSGNPAEMDGHIANAINGGLEASNGSLAVVVTATGATATDAKLTGDDVASAIERELAAPGVVEASVPGGLFLDQEVLVDKELSEDEVLNAMRDLGDSSGAAMFQDVFPAIAVSFQRYC
jgi:hypothetical protein